MRQWRANVAVLLLASLLLGCTSQQAQDSLSRENSHLRWLIRLYLHAGQQGHSPKSEQDFRQFVGGVDAAMRDRTLAAAGVSNLDELFISERDGLPYVIFYGSTPSGVATGVLAYEQKGSGGRRYVGYTMGVVEDVDSQRFDALVPAAARAPQ